MDPYNSGQMEGGPHSYNQPMTGDEQMGGVEEQPPPQDGGFANQARPQTSQSADFPMGSFTPQTDGSQFQSSSNSFYQQQSSHSSRPSSGFGSANGQGYNGQVGQDPRAVQQQEQSKTQSSVVIKVGMVGDAQIGKTSLMVKYVEGAWDEDYIQTLGRHQRAPAAAAELTRARCELYGKDHFDTEHRDHILDLGSWWAAGIRQHATPCLQ